MKKYTKLRLTTSLLWLLSKILNYRQCKAALLKLNGVKFFIKSHLRVHTPAISCEISKKKITQMFDFGKFCFVHPIFSSSGFGILVTLVAWFFFRFFLSCPSCLIKCKPVKDCVIFLYFHNFIIKSDQKPKNWMNETFK